MGDQVPADVRVFELASSTLKADQSALTGESDSVIKTVGALPARGGAAGKGGIVLQDKTNMLFSVSGPAPAAKEPCAASLQQRCGSRSGGGRQRVGKGKAKRGQGLVHTHATTGKARAIGP